jgi:hypothetical protein
MQSWDHDAIADLAREIWIRQGCPEGRAEEHWHEAEEIFRDKWLADQVGIDHQVRDLRAQPSGHL